MARQVGLLKITGTIDDTCFYKMCGDFFARKKSSLTGKRFWKDKAFEGSRKSCERFASGNKIASSVYALVAEEKRAGKLFSFLKRKAVLFLKEGVDGHTTEQMLIGYLVDFGFIEDAKRKELVTETGYEENLLPAIVLLTADPCVRVLQFESG
jgi:hypothetical protein